MVVPSAEKSLLAFTPTSLLVQLVTSRKSIEEISFPFGGYGFGTANSVFFHARTKSPSRSIEELSTIHKFFSASIPIWIHSAPAAGSATRTSAVVTARTTLYGSLVGTVLIDG